MSDLNAQPVESTFDALDGSSTGTRVSSNWVISLQANDSRELGNPNGNGAICEAITRPNMRFVATKTPEQQSCLMLHRMRQSRCRPKDKRVLKLARACTARSAQPRLVPTQHSSGGKEKLGTTSKRGDRYLRGHSRRAGRDPLCQEVWHPPTLSRRIA